MTQARFTRRIVMLNPLGGRRWLTYATIQRACGGVCVEYCYLLPRAASRRDLRRIARGYKVGDPVPRKLGVSFPGGKLRSAVSQILAGDSMNLILVYATYVSPGRLRKSA